MLNLAYGTSPTGNVTLENKYVQKNVHDQLTRAQIILRQGVPNIGGYSGRGTEMTFQQNSSASSGF